MYSRSDDDKDSDDSDSSEYSELEEDSEDEGEEGEVDDNVDDDESDGDDESDKEDINTESSANKSDQVVKKKKSRRDFLLNLQSVSGGGEGSSKGEGGEGIQPIDEYAYDSSDEEDVRYKEQIFCNEMDFTKLYKREKLHF